MCRRAHLRCALLCASLAIALLASPTAAQSASQQILALREAVVRHDWAQASATLADRRAESQRDVTRERRYLYAYKAFDTGDTTLGRHLDAWVVAQPASSLALVARAEYLVRQAWNARGHAFAAKVSAQQFELMRSRLRLAAIDATAAATLDSTDVAPHFVMLAVALLMDNDDYGLRVLEAAKTIAPGSAALPLVYMESLRPRWGGSEESMTAFADAAQRELSRNAALRTLRGFADYDRGEALREDDQADAAVAAYTAALAYGENPKYRAARAHMFLSLEEPQKALTDIDHAILEIPGSASYLAYRSMVLATLAADTSDDRAIATLRRRGHEDLRIALALDATDPEVVWARKEYARIDKAFRAP